MLRGGGCPRSTRRGRKTSTWERGAREDAAHTGNFCRTCRVGEQKPTSLWGIAKRESCSPVTEASPTEEPCEGKLHAGICAGGAGRPAFLPRRAPGEAWCVLQGASPCWVRVSHPPVASVASVAESRGAVPTNKTDEAYTENRIGRRGNRVP